MAPGRIPAVLDPALQSGKAGLWREEDFPPSPRFDLPDGDGKSHLGSAAHSWRTVEAGIQALEANGFALGAASPDRSRTSRARDGISPPSPRGQWYPARFHAATAYVTRA